MLKKIIEQEIKSVLLGETVECKMEKTNSVLEHFLVNGKTYHIRTVTMDYAGTLVMFDHKHLVLKDASWVADSGRFNEYLKDTSKINENEPY